MRVGITSRRIPTSRWFSLRRALLCEPGCGIGPFGRYANIPPAKLRVAHSTKEGERVAEGSKSLRTYRSTDLTLLKPEIVRAPKRYAQPLRHRAIGSRAHD